MALINSKNHKAEILKMKFNKILILFLLLIVCCPAVSQGKGVLTYITVTGVTGADEGDNDETNVDIFRNLNCDDDATTTDPEPFSDLKATITLDNSGHPNYEGSFWGSTNQDVKITSYKIRFKRNSRKLPKIRTIKRSTSALIAKDTETDITITILPKSKKRSLARKYVLKFGEDPSDDTVEPRFLDYTVKIKIRGEEVYSHHNKVKTKTELTMTLTQVDNCN